MKIGIDLTVLQTAHRQRGVGATLINILNSTSSSFKANNDFVFFVDPEADDPLSLIDLTDYEFEVRPINGHGELQIKVPRRISRVVNAIYKQLFLQLSIYIGDRRKANYKGIQCFLQFNQSQPLPKVRGLKTVTIAYDIIPYIMEYEYLAGYRASRLQSKSIKRSIFNALKRLSYKNTSRQIFKQAHKIVAISKHTKNDLAKYLKLSVKNIEVVYLGIDPVSKTDSNKPEINMLEKGSWGYQKKPLDLTHKKFLLFVGGADPRRRLSELVAAYNLLRAQNYDVHLVLVGDTMFDPDTVGGEQLRDYFLHTSYLDHIYFLGFVDNSVREWLYSNALAFVYPSKYEGFGLPVLEAMKYGTPVITFKNSSIYEIAKEDALYATDFMGIADSVKLLIDEPTLRSEYSKKGTSRASRFAWTKTSAQVFGLLD